MLSGSGFLGLTMDKVMEHDMETRTIQVFNRLCFFFFFVCVFFCMCIFFWVVRGRGGWVVRFV